MLLMLLAAVGRWLLPFGLLVLSQQAEVSAQQQPYVWPLPQQLSASLSSSPSVLSPDITLMPRGNANDVTASAIARYGPILRDLTSKATNGTAVVDTVNIYVDPTTDTAILSLSTPYNYSLSLGEGTSSIQLRAASRFGVAHGLETLAQLYARNQPSRFSSFGVLDGPVYPYRALMIDCGRRFVPIPTLEETIDGMAAAKMSVLNLHASEYGFFRVEVKAFPELTAGLGSAFYQQQQIRQLIRYAYLRGIRVIPQFDVPGHSSGLLPLAKTRGIKFCVPYSPSTQAKTQLYDDPAGMTLQAVTTIYDELMDLFPDVVFDIGGDETHVSGNCTLDNIRGLEAKLLKHIENNGKRGMGWEQIYKVTGAAEHRTIVRVYDSSPPVDKTTPLLLNVTAAGLDAVVADSAAYYMNSCCPAVHGKKLCELGGYTDKQYSPFGVKPCYFTDIAAFNMGNLSLSTAERQHLLGGSASMWTDAYCATNECGAWTGVTPEAAWMAQSPARDAVFHDSLLASIFPAAAVSGGAFYNYQSLPMEELTQRWAVFNDAVIIGRGIRSCPNNCSCAEDNFCGKLYELEDYPPRATTGFNNAGTLPVMPWSFDCSSRQLAWDYGRHLLPSQGSFKSLFDALQLQACGLPVPNTTNTWQAPLFELRISSPVIFVDWANGNDANTGSVDRPLKTVQAAVDALKGQIDATIALRSGTHFISAPIVLDASSSGLTIQNYQGEAVFISGGRPLPIPAESWQKHRAVGNNTVWVVNLKEVMASPPSAITSLRVTGQRAIRARYPDGDPETNPTDYRYPQDHYSQGWITGPTKWTAPRKQPPAWNVHVTGADWPGVEWPTTKDPWPFNHSGMWQNLTGEGGWGEFSVGVGGSCSNVDPPAGYWCATAPPRNPDGETTYRQPSGLSWAESLPQAAEYAHPEGAVIHAWQSWRWYTWQVTAVFDVLLSLLCVSVCGGIDQSHSANLYIRPQQW